MLSVDAALWGTSLRPEDVYRYARGEELTSFKGWKTKLRRPLEWTVVADHSDAYGFYTFIKDGADFIVAEPQGARWYQMLKDGKNKQIADELIKALVLGDIPWDINKQEYIKPGWEETVGAAEAANDPGNFTAFIAYEWTANPKGDNNHRVVIYRDAADKALQILPLPTMLMGKEGPDPETLWRSLQAYEEKTGGQVMAIPHNGNWSSGQMFQETKFQSRTPFDKSYIENRIRWEPLYETTQIKGDGEAHPFLSPDDEFADYETWDVSNLSFNRRVTTDMLQYEYARSALKLGLNLPGEVRCQSLPVRPYRRRRFPHRRLPGQEEDNFMGKSASSEPDPERWSTPFRKGRVWHAARLVGGRVRSYRYLGHREYPRGALGRHGAQRGLRHDRHKAQGTGVWRLGFQARRRPTL